MYTQLSAHVHVFDHAELEITMASAEDPSESDDHSSENEFSSLESSRAGSDGGDDDDDSSIAM